jgi:dTDP-4-dehydrorhamnose reductase
MMGGGPMKDKKFIKKIMLQLKDGKKELFVVNDKLGTPTYTHDFARNVKLLLEKEFWGLYNMVCDGITGRFEVAQELIKVLNLEDKVKVTPVDSEFWESEYFADRPPSERLINRKLDVRGVNEMRDWQVCLQEYIATYYENYLK